jgi:hypothetical protein
MSDVVSKAEQKHTFPSCSKDKDRFVFGVFQQAIIQFRFQARRESEVVSRGIVSYDESLKTSRSERFAELCCDSYKHF